MSHKKLLVLGGALLLAAGCAGPAPTTPIKEVQGGSASSTLTAPGQQKRGLGGGSGMMSAMSDSSGTCVWVVTSGVYGIDSSCVRQDQ